MEKKICCICGKEFEGYGNNPEPVFPLGENEENYCCDDCNWYVVTPVRVIIGNVIQAAKVGERYFDVPPRPTFPTA